MDDDSNVPVLVRTLDRLYHCAEGPQTRICLTSSECEAVCAYIWWLTDRCSKAEEKLNEVD